MCSSVAVVSLFLPSYELTFAMEQAPMDGDDLIGGVERLPQNEITDEFIAVLLPHRSCGVGELSFVTVKSYPLIRRF